MERRLGPSLRRLSNLCSRFFEQQAGRELSGETTGQNCWIIDYISRQEEEGYAVCQRDLEKRFGVTRSTASKVAGLMVRKGLLETQEVPGDRRLKRLTLTARARGLKRLMDDRRDRFEAALRRGFSDEELERLFSYLDRMQENLRFMEESAQGRRDKSGAEKRAAPETEEEKQTT